MIELLLVASIPTVADMIEDSAPPVKQEQPPYVVVVTKIVDDIESIVDYTMLEVEREEQRRLERIEQKRLEQERLQREEEERQVEQARAEEARRSKETDTETQEYESTPNNEDAESRGPEGRQDGIGYAKWEPIARCESGYGGEPDWSINTGNGFYGGLQFTLESWQWVGGEGYPHHASKEEQIRRAEILLERQGWGAWPACSSKVGYR